MKCVKIQSWLTQFGLELLGCQFIKDEGDGDKVDAALWSPNSEGMPHSVTGVRSDAQRAVTELFK